MSTENGAYVPEFGSDFDLQEEFKLAPMIPNGTYHANVTKVAPDYEAGTIVFSFCLVDNGGVMSDGETPVDGSYQTHRIWLPKAGDEKEMTKDGRMTKRQAKINMLGKFANDMGISQEQFKNLRTIEENIQNNTWIGMAANLTVGSREYEGKIFNEIKKIKAVG